MSAYILGVACNLSGHLAMPQYMPGVLGAAVGGLHAALNRAGMRRFWRAPDTHLNVVITGSAKGIGKALAREFLRAGDRVLVTSRTPTGLRKVMAQLREEVSSDIDVLGMDCDVSSPASVAHLAATAEATLGRVDVWINNAGYSGSFQAFMDATPEQLQQVVQTNLLGSMLCTRAAMKLLAQQPSGGHIFNMDGAGADGLPTPQYAAYGATKAGLAQLRKSLKAEVSQMGSSVGVHLLSPGMVLTGLLLEGATSANKQIFNILCEQPETVAAFLVPRIRTVVARSESSSYIKYLTIPRALVKFLTAPAKANKYFDKDGNPVYMPEQERIMGQKAKQTQRLAERAARRSYGLGYAYSMSMAAAYFFIMADALARGTIQMS
jgi:chlorophyll(ide) b reductase